MFRSSVALAFLLASSAGAQSISYATNNPSLIKGDLNKIVCEREDKIGTRLGGDKVCHTVAEWNQIHDGVRENAERLQMGVRVPGEDNGQTQFSIGDLTGPNGTPGGPHR